MGIEPTWPAWKAQVLDKIILEISGLDVTLQVAGKPVRILEQVNFRVRKGSVLGIVGESGSGKSLLCKSMLHLIPDNTEVSGVVTFLTSNEEYLDLLSITTQQLRHIYGNQIGFLFQEPMTSMNPVKKIGNQIVDVLAASSGQNKTDRKMRVLELLKLVGLKNEEKIENSYPHELSGGMLQRVALAISLTGEPILLIADEPTTALDTPMKLKIIKTLANLQKELDLTLILVSHDLNIISNWANELLIMYLGRIHEYGQTKDLTSTPSHPYTQALLKTEQSFRNKELPEAIPGELPSFINPPTGCRFFPRCVYSDSRCQVEEPGITPLSHGGGTRCYYPLRK